MPGNYKSSERRCGVWKQSFVPTPILLFSQTKIRTVPSRQYDKLAPLVLRIVLKTKWLNTSALKTANIVGQRTSRNPEAGKSLRNRDLVIVRTQTGDERCEIKTGTNARLQIPVCASVPHTCKVPGFVVVSDLWRNGTGFGVVLDCEAQPRTVYQCLEFRVTTHLVLPI